MTDHSPGTLDLKQQGGGDFGVAWGGVAGRACRRPALAPEVAPGAAVSVIDRVVQLLGGRGVVSGAPVEELYREVRSLRIYEGTSEVQQLVIAAQVLGDGRRE